MPINYSYKPRSGSRILDAAWQQRRSIGLSILAVALVVSFSLLSGRITGYMTYTSSLESTLNETMRQLNMESQERAECGARLSNTESALALSNDKLSSSQGYLVNCEKERDDVRAYSGRINALFSTCDSERSEAKAMYANETENYKNIVRNSVKAMCCSFGDSAAGTARSWGTEDNHIVCSGNYTVDCATGGTNY